MGGISRFSKVYNVLSHKGFFDVDKFVSRDNFTGSYIWLNNIEWMQINEILNFDYDDDMNQRVKPFALTGGGDYWGWYDSGDTLEEYPVVFCPTDDVEGIIYAPSLIGAVFRHIFEFSSQNNFAVTKPEPWEMELAEARKHLLCWIKSFSEFMPLDWIGHIRNLCKEELKLFVDQNTKEEYHVLLFPDDANVIIKDSLKYDQLDGVFEWCTA